MRMTLADVLAHQAKHSKASPQDAPKAATGDREDVLHNAIIAHCKQRGWIYFHGSTAHRAARTVGEPDFTLLLPAGRVLFVECKTAVGKLSPEQLGLKLWAEKLGHEIHTVRSMSEFLALTAKG